MRKNKMRAEVLSVIHQKPINVPVIGITGGKGGVGKSTIAINIVESLVQMGYKVALVDADVDAPDDHILLNISLQNQRNVVITTPLIDDKKCSKCRKCVDICRRNALFQPKNSPPILIGECNGCEACVLVCPDDAIEKGKRTVGKTYISEMGNLTLFTGELIPGFEESSFVVNALKARIFDEAGDSDIIIIDTSPGTHCNVINALKGSDEAYAVTEPTPLGIHDLDLILNLLNTLQIKSNVIINRSDLPGAKERIGSVIKRYEAELSVEIPMDDLLVKSYIEGIPAVRMHPEAECSKSILRMSKEIAEKYIK